MKTYLFCGVNLLGDGLCTTPVLRELKSIAKIEGRKIKTTYVAQNQAISKFLDGNPDIDRVYYEKSHDKIRSMRGWGNYDRKHLFDVSKAFSVGAISGMHMTEAYGYFYGIDVKRRRPVVSITDDERENADKYIPKVNYICISPHSTSSTIDNEENRSGNKLWGDSKWREIIPALQEMGYEVVSLGASNDPKYSIPGLSELHGLPIKWVAAILEASDYFITIDNGLAHLGAAVNANIVEIYPEALPITWVRPHVDHSRLLYGYPSDSSVMSVLDALEDLKNEVE